MSAERRDYEYAERATADAINDHATRIDEMAARLASHGERLAKLEGRAAAPQPMSKELRTLAEACASKPDPKSWGDRMRKECSKQRSDAACVGRPWGHDLSTEDALIAEAEAAMKPEWRPMATAPRDGRWVVLRFGSSRNYTVAAADGTRRWRAKDGHLWDAIDFSGWLPIPGEGDA